MAVTSVHGWEAPAEPFKAPLTERAAVSLARLRRWEFWPGWAFYPPVVAYILWLGLKHRSPLAFTAANPALEASGFVGERKSDCLIPLQQRAPDLVAPLMLIDLEQSLDQRLASARRFVEEQGGYPIVLKPNIGQRGRGVAIIRDEAALRGYLHCAPGDVIAQRYISGAEFGVFVFRDPQSGRAEILSVTSKQFPQVVGDGRTNLYDLIRNHERARLISPLLWRKFAERMHWVPGEGEVVPLIEIGAHCRGSLFRDACELATPALRGRMEQLFAALPGYHFGRLDLRCPSAEALSRGEGLQILEVNGVSAEAAHIYEPGTPLWRGYASMLRQWRIAFEIGSANERAGAQTLNLREFFKRVGEDQERGRSWF